jgi:hypothetical protein
MQNPVEVPTAAEAGGRPEAPAPAASASQIAISPAAGVPELGGPTGPEPTRYGDWEKKGRCIDF